MPSIKINDLTIEVVQKKIKNIYLRVYPSSGRICISAPKRMSQTAIQAFALSKLEWLKKKIVKVETVKKIKQETTKKYITGELHFFMGESYTLNVFTYLGPPRVRLNHGTIELYVRPGTILEKRKKVLDDWYRQNLKDVISEYISKWEKIIKVRVKEFGVKKMKTRWGTCNITAQRIWLNLELAKKRPECLEFIIVHELVHLLERKHNKRFYGFMDQFLPEWKALRIELNNGGMEY